MTKRILVVEDNPDNRILITDVLSSMDYEVMVAMDGESGVRLAQDEVPDLILMDLSLPVKDGWTATSEIKAQENLKHIPIIALTAHAMVGDREKALQAGCDDYVSKPIDLRELSSKLTHFLDTLSTGDGASPTNTGASGHASAGRPAALASAKPDSASGTTSGTTSNAESDPESDTETDAKSENTSAQA